MSTERKRRYTLEEYLALEQSSNERYEYWDGEVFCMSGASESHAQIEGNIYLAFRLGLRGRECRVFPANMRIRVPSHPPYRYADVSALCGRATFEQVGGVDVLINPELIVEVLSDSTEAYDRGDKFTHYKSIPTFTEYLLVAQRRAHITHYWKQNDGAWSYEEINDLSARVLLLSLDCGLDLSEVYQDVTFPVGPPSGLGEPHSG